jgi:hypothetical protein
MQGGGFRVGGEPARVGGIGWCRLHRGVAMDNTGVQRD